MKILFGLLFLFSMVASAAAQAADVNIIPQPRSMTRLGGEFKFSPRTRIVAWDAEGRRSAAVLNDLLLKNYGFKLAVTSRPPKRDAIVFQRQGVAVGNPPPEAYGLTVSPETVQIVADETGQFYAIQSLLQLLPPDFRREAAIPAVDISDAPRFGYRGMHLDVSRHFFPVAFLKKHLDVMAQYKFNRFHWHLTDDQGWRIEIKKYPRLTEIGSKRPETMKDKNFQPYVGDATPVEGFYTQEQIREVVAYAKARRITVIPEIELPGHSSAALAAYPELGCKTDYQYKVQTTWGIFKEVFCPTDTTFKFLEDVLEETIALFPDSPYIHIGGDEVLKDHWKESAFVQELKRRENLKDEHEVQSYFIRRIEKFVNSKGKRIIGWDEILEGGLAPNATVMSWRGERGGIAAAKAGHDVIMTPTNALYFDYGQGDTRHEPINIGNHLPLRTVYDYNPVPKELTEAEAKFILGAQANLWTEYIKTPEKAEYMVFPRLLALSEVVWTPHEKKDFVDFERRLSAHYPRLEKQNVAYRIPEPSGLVNTIVKPDETVRLAIASRVPNGEIFYTLDGSEPTEKSTRLGEQPLEFKVKAGERVDLKTIVRLPSGRRSVVYEATFLARPQMAAAPEPATKTAGVFVKFYPGGAASLGDLERAQAVTFDSRSIQLPQFAERTEQFKRPFGAVFEGYLQIPEDGIYEFQIEADDAGRLEIGEATIVEALSTDGKMATRYGLAPLAKGFHKIRLSYLQSSAEAGSFNFRWGLKGTGLRRIYGSELFR